MTFRLVRSTSPPPRTPQTAAVERLSRVLNAILDAQEMLERLVRTSSVVMRPKLVAAIEDLEWTTAQLSTALAGLREADPVTS